MLGENLGLSPAPFGFRFAGAGLEFGDSPERPRRETERDKAQAWLLQNMKPGEWYPSHELLEGARQFGLTPNAIQRARENLGITQAAGAIRRNDDKTYEWMLPIPGEIQVETSQGLGNS